MWTNIESRRGEGKAGIIIAVLIVGAILLWMFSKTPEGEHAFKQVATAVQPPVQVTLTPFIILSGYYVNVTNTSSSSTLSSVTVTYTGASGNSKTQTVGTLKPGETQTVDPSSVGWTVEKQEVISVSASGNFVPKVLKTNVLIDK